MVGILEQDSVGSVSLYQGRLPRNAPYAPWADDRGRILPRCVFCGSFTTTRGATHWGWQLARERWHEFYSGTRSQPGWRVTAECRPSWAGPWGHRYLDESTSWWRTVIECEWCGSWGDQPHRGSWWVGNSGGLYADCFRRACELRTNHTRFIGYYKRAGDYVWNEWDDAGDTDYDGERSESGSDAGSWTSAGGGPDIVGEQRERATGSGNAGGERSG